MTRSRTYVGGRVHVRSEMCATCVFRPGNLMHLDRGRLADMVSQATADESGSITCHESLGAPLEPVCAGFHQRHATLALRLAEAMGVIEWHPPREGDR